MRKTKRNLTWPRAFRRRRGCSCWSLPWFAWLCAEREGEEWGMGCSQRQQFSLSLASSGGCAASSVRAGPGRVAYCPRDVVWAG
ncbi:hypothetical protein PR202_gb16308 [Eleusine coracana subsp. coracana]|uniref:Secreted protein n=1 Tax=Eleusine coracana subsp. coracana TaxID=191504 RepID=A0AAV5F179_ELECO|nr:hypothetical protein PR202_gb16308 [Eleusine coracana subsp. coracana]